MSAESEDLDDSYIYKNAFDNSGEWGLEETQT